MKHSIDSIAGQLYAALRDRRPIPPVRHTGLSLTIDDAYRVSEALLERRLQDGERLLGRKIGLTSRAVQAQLGVDEPDFGSLTSAMRYPNGSDVPISERLIQPKAEGEIAFVLGADLAGPGVSDSDVIAATEYVTPCFEIVDSRIRDWDIQLVDTVADNASCGLFVLGEDRAPPNAVDFRNCEMIVRCDGEPAATGRGSAAMGSPATCIAWLANAMARYGVSLRAGDILLSGSLVPFLPAKPGMALQVEIGGIGEASLCFS